MPFNTIGLGAAGLLTNNGTVSPGDVGLLQTSTMTGSYTQTMNGILLTDLDFDPAVQSQFTDRINLTGKANVSGTVNTVLHNIPLIQAGDRSSVLFEAQGGVTTGSITLLAPTSAIAKFSLVYTPNDIALRTRVNFAGVDGNLNYNRTQVGQYFNRIQAAGSSAALAPVIVQLFYTPDLASLGKQYDTFDAEIYANQIASALSSVDHFAQRMSNCADYGVSQGHGGCVWFSGGGNMFKQTGTYQGRAFRDVNGSVAGGFSHTMGDTPLTFAAGISYETVHSQIDNAVGIGDRLQVGASLSGHFTPIDLRVFGTFGSSSVAVQRQVDTPGGVSTAQARQEFTYGESGLALSRSFDTTAGMLRPALEGGYVWWNQQNVRENGADMLSLRLQDRGRTGFAYIRPSLTFIEKFDLGSVPVAFWVRGGYGHRTADASLTAKFAGAPVEVTPFTTRAFLDRDAATVGGAVQVSLGTGVSLRGTYNAEIGARSAEHDFSGSLVVQF